MMGIIRWLRQLWAQEPDFDAQWETFSAERRMTRAAEEFQVSRGLGTWVASRDMDPLCNVADRLYRTADGSVRRAYQFPLPHRPAAWFFPDKEVRH